MALVVEDLNKLCKSDFYLRFADKRVRLCRAFYHFLSMDGLEIAATTMCPVDACPVCTCTKDDLDNTAETFEYRNSSKVNKLVDEARAKFLDMHGDILPRKIKAVRYPTNSCPDVGPMSARCRPDVGPMSGRCQPDVGPMSV
jgi:hypothetical protein